MTLLELVTRDRCQFSSTDGKLGQHKDSGDAAMKFGHNAWTSHKLIDTFFNRDTVKHFSIDADPLDKEMDAIKAHPLANNAKAIGNGISEGGTCQAAQLVSWIVDFARENHFEGVITDEDGAFAHSFFSDDKLLTALESHNRFARFRDRCTPSSRGSVLPRAPDALRLVDTVQRQVTALRDNSMPKSVKENIAELCAILSSSPVREMLLAHDLIAERLGQIKAPTLRVRFAPMGDSEMSLNTKRSGTDGDGEKDGSSNGSLPSVQREGAHRIVMVRRDDKPLGATIRNEGDTVVVARVLQGGRIHRRDLMREGDQIIAINGVAMHGQDIERVCRLLNEMPGILLFRILPNPLAARPPILEGSDSELYLRALFSYCAKTDRFMPCRELGLSFQRGDVLRIVDHYDVDWWQAHLVYSLHPRPGKLDEEKEEKGEEKLPGLMPSPGFQIRRKRLGASDAGTTIPMASLPRRSGIFRRIIERKCRRPRSSNPTPKNISISDPDDHEGPHILTYEAVTQLVPSTAHARPLVVVATRGIGSERLVEMLVAAHDEHLSSLPYHSTNPDSEHSLSAADFEKFQSQGILLDCHSQDDHQLGFHIEDLRRALGGSKTVVIRCTGRDLKFLRVSSIMPYIVFISPPKEVEKLREFRKHVYNLRSDEPETDSFLEGIIQASNEMDRDVGHFFDHVINLAVFNGALQKLHSIILQLGTEAFWVPAEWMTAFED